MNVDVSVTLSGTSRGRDVSGSCGVAGVAGRDVGGVGGEGRHGEADVAEGGGEGEADVEGSSEAVELNDDVEEAFERRWPCATENVTDSQ